MWFILKYWYWFALAAVLVGAIGAALNPVAALRLFKSASGAIVDGSRKLIERLRKSSAEDRWRYATFLMVVVAAILFIAWSRAGAANESLRFELSSAADRYEGELSKMEAATAANAAALSACSTVLEREQNRAKMLAADTDRAKREAASNAERIDREARQWQSLYASRPKSCDAALMMMEEACATLSDY